MHYAILCYDSEELVGSWSKEKDDAVVADLMVVQRKLAKEGKLGPVARLAPTARAKTLRKGGGSHITDGPFAETKEVLLGFFIVNCATLEEALQAAQELASVNPTKGCYEVRPLSLFLPAPASE